jgi:hypothetical protein
MSAHDAAWWRAYRARKAAEEDAQPCPRCPAKDEEIARLKRLLAGRPEPSQPFAHLAPQDRAYMERKLARKAPPVPRM